jgi:hypothetical protein
MTGIDIPTNHTVIPLKANFLYFFETTMQSNIINNSQI